MRPRWINNALWLAGIIATLVIVRYLWLAKGTPPGQPPLTSLTRNNLDQFTHDFNREGNQVRLVLLLSPT
jgi:hypothetical protein